jgi:hypothetical protein
MLRAKGDDFGDNIEEILTLDELQYEIDEITVFY